MIESSLRAVVWHVLSKLLLANAGVIRDEAIFPGVYIHRSIGPASLFWRCRRAVFLRLAIR